MLRLKFAEVIGGGLLPCQCHESAARVCGVYWLVVVL